MASSVSMLAGTTTGPLLQATTSMSGLEVDPDTDGAAVEEEHLLVMRDPNAPATADAVYQSSTSRQLQPIRLQLWKLT